MKKSATRRAGARGARKTDFPERTHDEAILDQAREMLARPHQFKLVPPHACKCTDMNEHVLHGIYIYKFHGTRLPR